MRKPIDYPGVFEALERATIADLARLRELAGKRGARQQLMKELRDISGALQELASKIGVDILCYDSAGKLRPGCFM